MLGALEYTVLDLQRIEFMGIKLQGDGDSSLRHPGDWAVLNKREMNLVENALRQHNH